MSMLSVYAEWKEEEKFVKLINHHWGVKGYPKYSYIYVVEDN